MRSVDTTGSPAPMVPSYNHFAPLSSADARKRRKRARSPLLAFLFGVTTWTPRASHSPYLSATASEEVLSTITAAASGSARANATIFATSASRSAATGVSAASAPASHSATARSPTAASTASGFMPSALDARIMCLESAHAAMRRSSPPVASSDGACAPTCFSVAFPMRPVPTKPTWRGTCGGGRTRFDEGRGASARGIGAVGASIVANPAASSAGTTTSQS